MARQVRVKRMIEGEEHPQESNRPGTPNSHSKASIANTAPSKTAIENAEVRRVRDDIPSPDRESATYRRLIDAYRNDRDAKIVQTRTVGDSASDKKIQVCVRKRPFVEKDGKSGGFDVVTTQTDSFPNAVVTVHEPKTRVDLTRNIENHHFSFDAVFDDTASNYDVYEMTGKPLVSQLFEEGGRCTFIAYGQTGSGKTHTIFGPDTAATASRKAGSRTHDIGIYQYIGQDIFRYLHFYNEQNKEHPLTVRTCFFEIYGGKIFDLAHGKNKAVLLEDHQGNMQIQGLSAHHTPDLQSLLDLIQNGNQERAKGVTEANAESSRSHAIFQISLVRSGSRIGHGQPSVNLGSEADVFGKFSIIDLAGSERGADTLNVERQARIEGAEINKSLLALKECIRALSLTQRKGQTTSSNEIAKHVPFRASKLTQVLRDSFIGPFSRTVLIATISPGSNCCEHTLNTLRYAARIKDFRVQLTHSESSSASMLEEGPSIPALHVEKERKNYEKAASSSDLDRKALREAHSKDNFRYMGKSKSVGTLPYLRKTDSSKQMLPKTQRAIANSLAEERDHLYKHLQQTVAELVNDESDLIKTHISVLQDNIDIAKEEESLLMEVSKSEYDMGKYTEGLISILERKIRMYRDLEGKVRKFSAKMLDEESTAKRLEEVQSRDFF